MREKTINVSIYTNTQRVDVTVSEPTTISFISKIFVGWNHFL